LRAGRANGGGKGIRTPDLLIANETLYQLSYTPTGFRATNLRGRSKTCKLVVESGVAGGKGGENSAQGKRKSDWCEVAGAGWASEQLRAGFRPLAQGGAIPFGRLELGESANHKSP
jgi:hypothetical protein